MSRLFVNSIKENDAINDTYRILNKMLRTNRMGNLYIQFTLSDRTGSISARMWNATEEFAGQFSDGDFVRCEGRAQAFQGALQVIAHKLEKVDPTTVEIGDFVVNAPEDADALFSRLCALLEGLTSAPLAQLASAFLDDEDFTRRFKRAYAGVRIHHAYAGGLLAHTVAVMELAARVGELYSGIVDPEILLVGAFLHDAGKVLELSDDPIVPTYTDEGQALGHHYLGAELVAKKIAEVEAKTGAPFDAKLAVALRHMILSHHGTAEFGSPKPPMTREAIALHHLDALDAKLNEFQKYIVEDPNVDKSWTSYIPALDRKLFK